MSEELICPECKHSIVEHYSDLEGIGLCQINDCECSNTPVDIHWLVIDALRAQLENEINHKNELLGDIANLMEERNSIRSRLAQAEKRVEIAVEALNKINDDLETIDGGISEDALSRIRSMQDKE